MNSPLILVDGSSYFFRAFHALPPLLNSAGKPLGAVLGVVNMIKRLIKDYKPTQLIIIFDAQGKTFRDELYPEYKAHRKAMPEDLRGQFQPLVDLLTYMGLPLLTMAGVEADDVIGTLTVLALEQGKSVLISTGDKDFAQLVNSRVTLVNTMSNQTLDPAGIKKKFGVEPAQIIDYLTLIGDTADNVPGVNKCGPKTAAKWLDMYQTLDNLIAHVDEIPGKVGDYLRASLTYLPLSKTLVTIKTDLSLPYTLAELQIKQPERERLISLLKELEFNALLREVLNKDSHSTPLIDSNILDPVTVLPDKSEEQPLASGFPLPNSHGADSSGEMMTDNILTTKSLLDGFLANLEMALKEELPLCINMSTSSQDPLDAEIIALSFAIKETYAVYIPFNKGDGEQLSLLYVLTKLKPFLENKQQSKIGYNLKYDYQVLKRYDINLQGTLFDVMLESYVLNSSAIRHDKESLFLKYLGYKTTNTATLSSLEEIAAHFIKEAQELFKLHNKLYSGLNENLKKVLENIEIPLIPVLADMELEGVLISREVLSKQGARLNARLTMLQQESINLAGREFNLNSPKQLQEILFDFLKLPFKSKTPKGQLSTSESVLQELAINYPLPALTLEYRSLNKLVSTYIEALPKRVSTITNRVHTSYNQAITATGRLSSSEPNLQNIPIRSEEGRLIRQAFIASPANLLVAADYSQIELRIMAHLSEDINLLGAFIKGQDVHTATASEIFQVDLNEVSSLQRRRAKAINFGLIYGMSAFGLAKQLSIGRNDAQYYIDCYFERYPGVLNYMERTRARAHEQGYVETIFGRRLFLPEINARSISKQKAAERAAINAPMQGTAADILKKVMIKINDWQLAQAVPSAKMIMQVHDELVFEVQEGLLGPTMKTIRDIMEHVVTLSVPLIVSIGSGHNWDEAHQ